MGLYAPCKQDSLRKVIGRRAKQPILGGMLESGGYPAEKEAGGCFGVALLPLVKRKADGVT